MDLLPALSGAVPDRPDAVRIGDERLSWERLGAAAAMVADRIAGAPVVAVDAVPAMATVVGVVAALLAGVPVVPVPPDSGSDERAYLLRDSGAALLLTVPERLAEARASGVPAAAVHPGSRRWLGDDPAGGGPPGPDAALILYTSGTTGPPKGALLSRAAIAADLDALADAWGWTPQDRLAHGLPLFHVHGLVLGVLGPLRVGSPLVHTVRPTPAGYAAAGATMYFGVPTVWSRVAADPDAARALRPARLLVSGSAALPVPVFERLADLSGHRPVERYGMTETLITISARADGERRPGQVGTPVAGISTRIVDDAGAVLPRDGESVGELELCGPTLFSGYLNRAEATAAAMRPDGWFRTGDVASIGPDGWHRIVGRASIDLIKCGGYRIGAGEVENALLSHPAVREAAVLGIPDADLGERIVAYVVADGAGERELIDHVARVLSAHKRPRRVYLLDALPRNAMGKVQKQLLRSP